MSYVGGWDFAGLRADILWVRWIIGGLNQRAN